jgi:hypothetical protein
VPERDPHDIVLCQSCDADSTGKGEHGPELPILPP